MSEVDWHALVVEEMEYRKQKWGTKVLKINPTNPNFYETDGTVIAPTPFFRFGMIKNCAIDKRCKNCHKLFGLPKTRLSGFDFTNSRCQHCNANLNGKVISKPRDIPRVVKEYFYEQNSEVDNLLTKILNDNTDITEDAKTNPKAIGRLVGLAKKVLPQINGGELNARLSDLIEELQ
jgi:hypothetical protein